MPCKIILDDNYMTLTEDAGDTLDVYAIKQSDPQGTKRMIDAWAVRYALDAKQAKAELQVYCEQEVLFSKIAREALGIATLETRNMDALDFHEVSVGSVRAALRRAYKAGQSSVTK